MSLIYVVFGSAGEYSDRDEWPVKAFTTEAAAQELVTAATKRANELYVQYPGSSWDIPKGENEHDPNMKTDYTGTSYYYAAVELVAAQQTREGSEP